MGTIEGSTTCFHTSGSKRHLKKHKLTRQKPQNRKHVQAMQAMFTENGNENCVVEKLKGKLKGKLLAAEQQQSNNSNTRPRSR
jgi:hypothetical protein